MKAIGSKVAQYGVFLKPWMTTVGLLAVNIALIALVLVSPVSAQREFPYCQTCYEGLMWVNDGYRMVHAIDPFNGLFGSKFGGAYETNHNYFAFYSGACRSAHYDKRCCLP